MIIDRVINHYVFPDDSTMEYSQNKTKNGFKQFKQKTCGW